MDKLSTLVTFCEGNSPVTCGFHNGPVIKSYGFYLGVSLKKSVDTLLISPWAKWPLFRKRYFQMYEKLTDEKFCIFIKISLKFILTGPTDNNPALV